MNFNETFIISSCQKHSDLHAIKSLQEQNLKRNLKPEEISSQGFVTLEHDLKLLSEMNTKTPHIVCKKSDRLVAYALSMHPEFRNRIPLLETMFQQIEKSTYQGIELRNSSFLVMGQICIHKDFRGKGIFTRLYEKMVEYYNREFKYIITEVDTSNKRSLRAHEKAKFETLLKYNSDGESTWIILIRNTDSKTS